jgi:Domain of unknown function (DUF4785)
MRMSLSLSIAIALVSFSASAAQPLKPLGRQDQAPKRLVALPAPAAAIERAPVSFSWKLDPGADLVASKPFVSESREYWQTVEGTELDRGLQLKMSAPGSLIRISPATGARGLRSEQLQIMADDGRRVQMKNIANAEQMKAAGMDVASGSLVAKMGDNAGAGEYTLRAAKASGRYVVHVFEPASTRVLRATTDREHALAGDTLRLNVDYANAGRSAKARAEALLVAPDGRSWPVAMLDAGGGLAADVKLPSAVGTTPGLWELQVFAEADGVPRDTRTAFAVAAPTARFNGMFAFNAKTMRMALPIQAGSAGRYEARGTLFAKAPDGQMRPVSQAHSANWFKRGSGMLVLQFDRTHVPAGYGAPFEVRQLELHDQTRMVPLESRQSAGRAR